MVNRKRPDAGPTNKKSRKVVSWQRVRSEMRRRAAQSSRPEVPVAGSVVMFPLGSALHASVKERRGPSEIPHPLARVLPPESHEPAAHAERLGPQCHRLQTSSATQPPRLRGAQSQGVVASSAPVSEPSDPEASGSCLIMGKNLPNSQRVELYQPETHYQGEVLALIAMAKSLAKHEEDVLAALRANLDVLRAGMSQADIGIAAGGFRGDTAIAVGRNVANLTGDKSSKRVKGTVNQIPIAARAFGVEAWQLWVPLVHLLSPSERQQLQEIVRLFVEEPITRPWFLAALSTATATTKAEGAIVTAPRQSKR